MSTLKLYKTKITPDRNAQIEGIEQYLSGITPSYASSGYQYVQIGPKINLKLNLGQSFVGSSVGNYAAIEQDGKKFYYFIIKANWKGKQTVELELAMDTINTFSGDFTFTDKTNVVREHKDRFAYESELRFEHVYQSTATTKTGVIRHALSPQYRATEVSASAQVVLGTGSAEILRCDKKSAVTYEIEYRVGPNVRQIDITIAYTDINPKIRIDKQSEGIQAPLYGHQIGQIQNKDHDDYDWFLIYNSQSTIGETTQKPTINFMASNELNVACKETGGIWFGEWNIHPEDLDEGYWYWIDFQKDDQLDDYFDGGFQNPKIYTELPAGAPPDQIWFVGELGFVLFKGTMAYCLAFRKVDANTIEVKQYDYRHPFNVWEFDRLYGETTTGVLHLSSPMNSFVVYKSRNIPDGVNRMTMNSGRNGLAVTKEYYSYASESDLTIKQCSPYYRFDNTPDDLIKVVKLPYCPVNYTIKDISTAQGVQKGFYFEKPITIQQIGSESTGYSYIRLGDLSTVNTPFDYIMETGCENPMKLASAQADYDFDYDEPRHIEDTKLYHSDFYQPRFVYDSFEFTMQLELIDRTAKQPYELRVEYVVSSVVSSRFMFRFPDYVCDYNSSSYYNQLVIDRNNEMPIFNNDYISYLRNGYNYDQKNKELSTTGTWLGVGIGAATTVAGIVTAVFGPKTVGAGLIISGVSSIVSSVSGGIISTAKAENAMEEKKAQLSARGTSVSQCDDIDLTSVYTGNKAKLMLYEPSEQMKKLLDDAFYYTGYICNERKIPTHDNRVWFDFLSCEAVFAEEATSPYNEYLADIKNRFANGVTIFHNVRGHWDLDQTKENVERALTQL